MHKMNKSKMGYRVSKANEKYNSFVKEQRIDGSWRIHGLRLRYILIGLKTDHKVKNHSNLFNNILKYSSQKFYHSPAICSNSIHPWALTGLTDAEGTFVVKVSKSAKSRLGRRIEVSFEMELHKKDEAVLNQIRSYFGNIGSVRKRKTRNICVFKVTSLNAILTKIIPHFDEYPLITQKKGDYLLFKQVALIMRYKEHLTEAGFQKIINIRASINWGLNSNLKTNFPLFTSVPRPIVENQIVSNGF